MPAPAVAEHDDIDLHDVTELTWDVPARTARGVAKRLSVLEARLGAHERLSAERSRSLAAQLADVRTTLAEHREASSTEAAEMRGVTRELTTTVWKLGVVVALVAGGSAAAADALRSLVGL